LGGEGRGQAEAGDGQESGHRELLHKDSCWLLADGKDEKQIPPLRYGMTNKKWDPAIR
jgi:hypothetical protein